MPQEPYHWGPRWRGGAPYRAHGAAVPCAMRTRRAACAMRAHAGPKPEDEGNFFRGPRPRPRAFFDIAINAAHIAMIHGGREEEAAAARGLVKSVISLNGMLPRRATSTSPMDGNAIIFPVKDFHDSGLILSKLISFWFHPMRLNTSWQTMGLLCLKRKFSDLVVGVPTRPSARHILLDTGHSFPRPRPPPLAAGE